VDESKKTKYDTNTSRFAKTPKNVRVNAVQLRKFTVDITRAKKTKTLYEE